MFLQILHITIYVNKERGINMTNNKAYDVGFEKDGVVFRGVVSYINKRIIIDSD